MNIKAELEARISAALSAATGIENCPAIVAPAANARFGDYQANGVMAAAKAAKTNPRQLAAAVLEKLDLADLAETVEIAGPGFINITLSNDLLAARLAAMTDAPRCGLPETLNGRTVVVDYCGPNLAKEMHVGHLRSTIIGDCFARVLEFLGARVIRQNHVGDWGTQFGMLIAHFEQMRGDGRSDAFTIADMEDFYRQAKRRFDCEAEFADLARRYVVRLQGGDEQVRAAWRAILDQSLEHCRDVLATLGASLSDDDVRGESFYNDRLPDIVAQLDAQGMLSESEGAGCVFIDEDRFRGADGELVPVIVRKSDGGYLYATTDLAALRFRAGELKADRILYVTDSRQAYHFAQVFAVARRAGFVGENVSLEHIPFGMMLGADGKPFKTRTGGTVKLADLLNEAIGRASAIVAEKSPELPAEKAAAVASAIGVGAVKYADLSMDLTSDYKFSWDKMLSLQGNTAPYMQYAYARVRSIFRKAAEQADAPDDDAGWALSEPAERTLALRLARLEETLAGVAAECRPNILTAYLYDVAGAFSGFYEACPVLKSSGAVRQTRLALCGLTARVIERGLDLLGIDVIEQM